jgi:hypothetical protein
MQGVPGKQVMSEWINVIKYKVLKAIFNILPIDFDGINSYCDFSWNDYHKYYYNAKALENSVKFRIWGQRS